MKLLVQKYLTLKLKNQILRHQPELHKILGAMHSKKIPHEVLRKIRIHIEQEFKSELEQYNTLRYSMSMNWK